MGWEAFARGDVIVQGETHTMLWVDGDKPVVHNVDEGRFSGVIRQSEAALSTYAAQRTRIFRLRDDAQAAARAADFAIDWATVPAAHFDPTVLDGPAKKIMLRSPYSHGRMGGGLVAEGTPIPWSVDALFRAFKAIARQNDGMGLSPNHGMSCSQFATLCFQAAILKDKYEEAFPPDLLQEIRRETQPREFNLEHWGRRDYATDPSDSFDAGIWALRPEDRRDSGFRSLKKDREDLEGLLLRYVEKAAQLLPKALRVDAKVTTVSRFLDSLRETDSGFAFKGTLDRAEQGYGINTP